MDVRTSACQGRQVAIPPVPPRTPMQASAAFREMLASARLPRTMQRQEQAAHHPDAPPSRREAPPSLPLSECHRGREDSEPGGSSAHERSTERDSSDLDPLARALAWEVPARSALPGMPDDASARVDAVRAAVIEPLLQALVRRAAWGRSPDGRATTLRLEVGDGPLAGATVLITADSRDLQIELDAPPDIDLEAWKARLRHRLASQGLTAVIA